jgi:hypothetical protein
MPTSQKRKHSNAGLPNNLLQAVGHVAVLWSCGAKSNILLIGRFLHGRASRKSLNRIGLSKNQTVLESAKLDDF